MLKVPTAIALEVYLIIEELGFMYRYCCKLKNHYRM